MFECCFSTLEVILVSDFFLSHFNQCFISWEAKSQYSVHKSKFFEDRRESRCLGELNHHHPLTVSYSFRRLHVSVTGPQSHKSKVAEGGVRPVRLLRKHFIRRGRKTKQPEVEKEQVSNVQTIFQRYAGVGFSEGLRLLKRPVPFPARQSVG